MSFDSLAPHYRWMEWLLAGGKLQRCRTGFLPKVQHASRALLLGEGNGRFLGAFARINPSAEITVLDNSGRMLEEARRRVARLESGTRSVSFVCADILKWTFATQPFDLIVTNFFFDCFRPDQLAFLVPRIAAASRDDALWLLSDFRVPAHGPAAWRARSVIRVMYFFFRAVTGIPANEITPMDPLLKESRFQLRERRITEWGLLHTDLWQRHPGELRRVPAL